MVTKLIGITGRAQSGKSTSINYLYGYVMQKTDPTGQFTFRVGEEGELIVRSRFVNEKTFKEEIDEGVLDISQKTFQFINYAQQRIWPHIKMYNFAETLKDICIEVLGLDYEQCYGTNEQKDTLTNYLWENMPGNVKPAMDETESLGVPYATIEPKSRGKMTGREVLQYVGTEIFRKMNGNVWVDNCLRQIESEQPAIAIVGDCRFPNEADAIKKAGGKLIRLTRNPLDSKHVSETAMDGYEGYDVTINNDNLTIEQCNQELIKVLRGWGVVE